MSPYILREWDRPDKFMSPYTAGGSGDRTIKTTRNSTGADVQAIAQGSWWLCGDLECSEERAHAREREM